MNDSANSAAWLGTTGLAVFLIAAATSFLLLWLLYPRLRSYMMAQPNARSSHSVPTPQGGGIGVVAATIGTSAGAFVLLGYAGNRSLWLILAATLFVAIVGVIDDRKPIPVLPRLLLQAAGVAIVILSLPNELRVFHHLPFWLERTLIGFALLWLVNLVNFMDGIDWMTAAEIVPVTLGLATIAYLGALTKPDAVIALALCGAVVGFAPLNRPVAKLFLGDVGSLAIGLLLGWLLLKVAAHGGVAAVILPLYYIADATITLFWRFARGEPIWQAHRTHFYQRAMERGFTVMEIVGRVFAVNIALAIMAIVSVYWNGLMIASITLTSAAVLVGWLLVSFATRREASQ